MSPADRERAARRELVRDPPVAVCPRCGEFFGWIPGEVALCLVCRMMACVLATWIAWEEENPPEAGDNG